MKVRRIPAIMLAICMLWCAAAAEETQPEEAAAEPVQASACGAEAGAGTNAEPSTPAAEEEPGRYAKEPAALPEGKPSVQHGKESTVMSAETMSAQSGEEPAAQPAGEPAAPSGEEPPVQPAQEPAVCSEWEPAVQPDEKPAAQPGQKPAAPPDEGPSLQPAEEPAAQPGPVQLPAVTDGSVNPGESVKCRFAGGEERVWALEISAASDLLLKAEGLPVQVIVSRASDGHTVMRETAPEEGLEKEFMVTGGSYLVCFRSMAEPAGELTWTLERRQEENEEEPEEAGTEPEGNEGSGTPGEPETDADKAETESGEEGGQTEGEQAETAEGDPSEEEPESTEATEPEGASGEVESENGEASGISVRLHSNLEDGAEAVSGTEVVIRAEVTGTDRPCRLQWQYSPDGGKTVLDAEEAAGSENRYFRYILDETNMHYLWRVAVIFDMPEE